MGAGGIGESGPHNCERPNVYESSLLFTMPRGPVINECLSSGFKGEKESDS